MKTTGRVFCSGTSGHGGHSSNQENMPWNGIMRGMAPLSARSPQQSLLEQHGWLGINDERWRSRLMASLCNTGRVRLKFRA